VRASLATPRCRRFGAWRAQYPLQNLRPDPQSRLPIDCFRSAGGGRAHSETPDLVGCDVVFANDFCGSDDILANEFTGLLWRTSDDLHALQKEFLSTAYAITVSILRRKSAIRSGIAAMPLSPPSQSNGLRIWTSLSLLSRSRPAISATGYPRGMRLLPRETWPSMPPHSGRASATL